MPNVTALGLSKIEVADVVTSPATEVWAALGKTYENTCKMTEDDPTENEFYCEEEDDPVEIILKRGKTKLTWSIMNLTAATCEKVFGGIYTEGTKTWGSPANIFSEERAIKVTPQIGCSFIIPRAKFYAKITADFNKQGLFLAECTARILVPTDTTRKRLEIVDPT